MSLPRVLAIALPGVLAACVSERAVAPRADRAVPDAGAPAAAAPPASPPDARAALAAARDALSRSDHARARPLLEHALADRALAPVAGRLLAESHLSEGGDLVAAEAALTVAAGAAPQDPDVAATLARLRQAQGRYAEAHAALRALAAARPGDAAVHESLASVALTLATLANARGDAADRTAWATRAAEDFREARRDAGDLPAYAAGEARALEMAGNLAGAEAALLHAVELGGDAPAARVTLMEFYERTGQRQKADAERRKAGDAAAPQKRRLRPLPPSR